jgi:hypothetical protein
MNSPSLILQAPEPLPGLSIQDRVTLTINDLLESLPESKRLSADERRGIIARYTAVLEGNFIYWMTGALLCARAEESRAIILDNLHEEVRDCHPGMMRRFALAAGAVPTDSDALAVSRDLMNVRLFVGRLQAVRLILMMTFFEAFLQRFMAYLGDLAELQCSVEKEYTDVHGVCDIAHTAGLFRALAAEMALDPAGCEGNIFEGVELLTNLIRTIVHFDPARSSFDASRLATQ